MSDICLQDIELLALISFYPLFNAFLSAVTSSFRYASQRVFIKSMKDDRLKLFDDVVMHNLFILIFRFYDLPDFSAAVFVDQLFSMLWRFECFFVVSSENISAEDYATCLQVLVEKAQQNSGSVNTITGEIVVIDPYANHIGVRLDKEQAPEYSSVYGIDLPDGQSAGDYSLGDRVEVMYTGEPATILTIWAEQLVDIKLLK